MKKILLTLIVIYLIGFTVERQKKKQEKPPKKPFDPKSKRPDSVAPELYCDACQAIIKEARLSPAIVAAVSIPCLEYCLPF